MTPASTLLVDRPTYLDRLWKRRHNGMVKVIQGPRRCGKSTLLKLFQMRLRDRGVGADHLVSFNLEDRVHASLLTADALHDAVMQKVEDSGMHYVFIDEVQMCPGFERAVDSLILRENIDLYITGSNAFMLSGELATLLTGRYMPLEVMPLSFSEYRSGTVSDGLSVEEDFQQYIRGGSFPALLKYRHDETYVDDYYQMLQNSMIVKDIAIRHQFKKIDLLERLTRFLASGVGSIISARKIADTLSSEKEDVSNRTISDYLKALAESYFFLAVPRFDVVGRQLLRGNEKYYLCDPGFRYHLVAARDRALGHIVENVVYLELRRRYTTVTVGKTPTSEIDFVAQRGDVIHYYQVSLSVMDEQTFEREIKAFDGVPDNYPKFLLSMDRIGAGENHNGIEQLHLLDWLLQTPE